MSSDSLRERRRHSVSDLHSDLDARSAELEIIWKALQSRGFPVGNRPVNFRMEVPTFLRFVELGADGD